MDHDIPSEIFLNLDQIPLSYVPPTKGSKNVPIKVLDDKRQITATFVVTATRPFLPIRLTYQGKSKRCLPKFTFSPDFHVMYTANHWLNLENSEDLFNVIIFPYLSAKKGNWFPRRAAFSDYHHSHNKRKDSLETRAVLLIFLLELEIFGVAVQRIHQNEVKS